jgi:recombination protein RecT
MVAESAKTLTLRESPRMTEFRDLLYRYKDRFAAILPRTITVQELMQLGLVAMGRDSKLLACTPQSIIRALIVAGRLGLDPTGIGGQAWIVPYKQTATLLVGYKGLLDLARRTGIVVGVEAHVVHERDTFRFHYGSEPDVHHEPVVTGEPGPMLGAYAILRLRGDAVPMMEYMTKAEIDKIRTRSRAGAEGPWVTDYEQMARKTTLRRILNYAPSSTELRLVMAAEDRFEEQGGNADMSDLVPMPVLDDEAEPATSKSEEMAQRLRQQQPEAKQGGEQEGVDRT